MRRFRDWLLTCDDASNVGATTFDFSTSSRGRTITVQFSETHVQRMLPRLVESGRAVWGRRAGIDDEDLGYRLLMVHLDDKVTTGRLRGVTAFVITEDDILPASGPARRPS
ncbi:hypothetical protein [Curtobacterium sp. APC 4022]|uniref:hypothetical protein n=1 Tax=Curtobacterium sp. APC 4022 TaxID=3035201 RepID=UPI0025B2C24A|nr:hypothetical protein [Curtobacterium sp. APC 4022]MDN3477063.1 hypothetical protein [Curtobacterium sp. APC 4022]